MPYVNKTFNMSTLSDIEFAILKDWLRSEDLAYYLEMGLGQHKSECYQFTSAFLRFTAYYNTKNKVTKLRIEGITYAKDLRNTLVALIEKKASEGECVLGLKNGDKPITPKRLAEKALEFRDSKFNLDYIVHSNTGNQYAAKIGHDLKAVIKGLYQSIGRKDYKYAYEMYKVMAATNKEVVTPEGIRIELIELSYSTLRAYLQSPDDIEPLYTDFMPK